MEGKITKRKIDEKIIKKIFKSDQAEDFLKLKRPDLKYKKKDLWDHLMCIDFNEINIYENADPTFLSKLLSLKSLCILDTGSVFENKFNKAFDNSKFASAFSK